MKHEIELQPFSVPNYVIQKMPVRPRQEGYKEAPKYHLSELDPETLTELCTQFIVAVREKAGQPDPALEELDQK